MLDRVREAMFSTLGGRFDGARVLDLFAGSGSLGLECLSRGAQQARMVERDAATLRLLRANVQTLGAAERAVVVAGDALSPRTWREGGELRYQVVFLDPPYPMLRDGADRRRVLDAAAQLAREALEHDGSIVLHAPRELLTSSEFVGLSASERSYGTSSLWYLTQPDARTELS
jgi:16S rRNA (guanine(966)-N(2))-methyltransferase RsmD